MADCVRHYQNEDRTFVAGCNDLSCPNCGPRIRDEETRDLLKVMGPIPIYAHEITTDQEWRSFRRKVARRRGHCIPMERADGVRTAFTDLSSLGGTRIEAAARYLPVNEAFSKVAKGKIPRGSSGWHYRKRPKDSFKEGVQSPQATPMRRIHVKWDEWLEICQHFRLTPTRINEGISRTKDYRILGWWRLTDAEKEKYYLATHSEVIGPRKRRDTGPFDIFEAA